MNKIKLRRWDSAEHLSRGIMLDGLSVNSVLIATR